MFQEPSFRNTHSFIKSFHILVQSGSLLAFATCHTIGLLQISFVYMWLYPLYKSSWFRWTVKKKHGVADIADVVVTRLRRIANSVRNLFMIYVYGQDTRFKA